MNTDNIKIVWPNGRTSEASVGNDWLKEANKAGINIPTGCLNGSCGACEIEVNGEVIRACISTIKSPIKGALKVDFFYDPFW